VTLNLYMLALRKAIPAVTPEIAVDIETKKPSALQNVPTDVLEKRLKRGDGVFTAHAHTEPVGYIFAAHESAWVGEIDTRLRIKSGDIYFYDAFTYPAYRGLGIYPSLLTYAAHHYRHQGYNTALIFSTAANRASSNAIRRAGFSCYQRIRFYDVWGLKMWHYTARKNHVKSYCAIEN
jgi:GNAT superfamily N-acetyltransferase